jgi:hypothetical protein
LYQGVFLPLVHVGFHQKSWVKKVRMVLEKRKRFMQKSGTKRSLFRLQLRLFDSMLSDFFCSMTCLKWLRLLNEPLEKNHMLFLLFGSIILVFSLMLYLGWLGACLHMLESYKVAISLYDHLVFNFWCHLMLLLMLLCRFAWLWPLLLS